MKNLEKIKRRIKFIVKESFGKNIDVIFYSLLPSKIQKNQKNRFWIEEFLQKRGFVYIDRNKKSIKVNNLTIFYHDRLPIRDVLSINLSENSFIRKNFLNNSTMGTEGSYEHRGVKLEKGDIVIDAGANIGMFSLHASQKIENGQVIAFEPIKETVKVLQKNIKENSCTNIEIAQYALGKENTEVNFFVDESSLVKSSILHDRMRQHTNIEKVRQVTLDDFVAKNNIGKIDFIKADIEGSERNFLDGAKQTIKKHKPKLAICIYHLPDDPEVIENKIREFVPEYKIHKTKTKLFAWIEKEW